jgi:putative ABC transport system permease protein
LRAIARACRAFESWLRTHKQRGERLARHLRCQSADQNAVDRAGRFLSLASLVSVLLCSIAVAMSARRYVSRHLDTVALLKTLGATRGFTLVLTLFQLLVIALLAAVVGSALGYVAQEWLVQTLRGLLTTTELPPASLVPAGSAS